jgi:integron integrase
MSQFIEEIREIMRTKRYSIKTEKAYVNWIKSYIRFHEYKHPKDMAEEEVSLYLNYLANRKKVSASTQNQALCGLVFLYRHVLKSELTDLKFGYSKQAKRLPTVMSAPEVLKILQNLTGIHHLIASILYGAGLRINEALSLRVKDIDFDNGTIFVFRGKGQKDRVSLLPKSISDDLKVQISKVKRIHAKDVAQGYGLTSLPPSLHKKYGQTLKDIHWQYIFPSTTRCKHPHDNYFCRHHLHESSFRKQLRTAVVQAQISKRVTAHTFRHYPDNFIMPS